MIRSLLWRSAGNTLIQRLLFGPGGDHCNLELAVEVRRRKEGGRGRQARQADIKSSIPHLTGGEIC